MLTITKSLKSYYKNPESIAHKVLADRIGEREPGNKPLPSDRIPYVYIVKKEKKGEKMLQGDKIELPRYILEHKLKPDYLTYITNQIMKPTLQIFDLAMDNSKKLLDDPLREYDNKSAGQAEITKWFTKS